ncbi:MAG: CHASE2 domain-containing protein [Elusimicrobiota bacterium]
MKVFSPRLGHVLGIILLAALVAGASTRYPRPRRDFNNFVQNIQYRRMGAQPGDPRIVLAAIDDESLSRIGEFPWRRSVSARLIDSLTRLGARTIAFDVMFLDPSEHPADDKALAAAIQRSGRVILAGAFNVKEDGRNEERHDPLPLFAHAAAGVGNVSIAGSLEPDGSIRSLATRLVSAGHPDAFTIGVTAVAHYLHQDPQQMVADLPARVRLNYRGTGSVRMIPVSHILDGQLTSAETASLRDALVFVGSVSPKAFDLHPSPFGGQIPGPLVQLTLADNILNHRWLATMPPAADFIACTAPAALVLVWCATLSSPTYFAGVAGVALAYFLASWLAFAYGLWLRPTGMLTSFLAALVWTAAARKHLTRGK